MTQISSWWPVKPDPGNVGDILTPYLVAKLTDFTLVHERPAGQWQLLGCGSIARRATNQSVMWGSGIISRTCPIQHKSVWTACRGPLTRYRLAHLGIRCPQIFGDPALLLPHCYQPPRDIKYRVGVISHYADAGSMEAPGDGLLINPLNADIENFIDQVCSCAFVVSSSLHGLIIAHAYGVPAAWMRRREALSGDGVKFADYFESLGLEPPRPCAWWEDAQPFAPDIKIDTNKLAGALGRSIELVLGGGHA